MSRMRNHTERHSTDSSRSLSIKHKILLLAILPVITLTIALVAFHIVTRTFDAERELNRQGTALAQYTAESSTLALFAGDIVALQQLSSQVINSRNVRAVSIVDQDQNTIWHSGVIDHIVPVEPIKQATLRQNSQYRFFQHTVVNSQIKLGDFDTGDQPSNASLSSESESILGWVQITVDDQALRERQRDILFKGLAIGLLGLLLVVPLAWRFALSLTQPLSALSEGINKLEQGEYSAQIKVRATGELKTILNGVNRLASQVEQSQISLRQEVKEATHSLSEVVFELQDKNRQLEQTGEKLQAANQAKDAFLAQMNHELRTPLTSILGYCRLLAGSDLDDEQQRSLDIVEKSSNVLLAIIEDVLDFSRLQSSPYQLGNDSTDTPLENTTFNLQACLDELLLMHQQAARDKGLRLDQALASNLPVLMTTDERRLKQVITNLLGNAIKFTDKGKITLRVSRVKGSPEALVFEVEDTGIGIAPMVMETIFEPFIQADSSISKRFGGSGLGLAISQQLVELMGGEISVSSHDGELEAYQNHGSTFQFSLPLVNKRRNRNAGKRAQVETLKTERLAVEVMPSLQGIHILIVEDNPLNRDLLGQVLSNIGAQVSMAENGQEAIDMVLAQLNQQPVNKFDLIIMDLHMPLVDGITASHQIRQYYAISQLPILLLTADMMSDREEELSEAGINETHYKPMDEPRLVQAIARLTNMGQSTNRRSIISHADPARVLEEVDRLLSEVNRAIKKNDSDMAKSFAHQLKGLSASPHQVDGALWSQLDKAILGGDMLKLVAISSEIRQRFEA